MIYGRLAMMKLAIGGTTLSTLLACVLAFATAQGRDDDEKRPGKKGPPPKGFKLGKLLPPHIMHELELTEEQREKLADLEKETRKKLEKIFTEDQLKQIEKLGKRPPHGPPPPRDGDDDDRPRKKGKGPPPRKKDNGDDRGDCDQ